MPSTATNHREEACKQLMGFPRARDGCSRVLSTTRDQLIAGCLNTHSVIRRPATISSAVNDEMCDLSVITKT